ncbi:TetR/AcrR family transcriptional regulator [Brevundimonas fontaquae]|uniref:TetR family transcriptional regulator C-terminal domain-containing protein n=1 Tax=Brevundimonas fontaquae TaxID=2813778 RepID=A0ABX7LR78_9CAUL|nr:TetR/AcrR family transcriptional regulator [Brevundimonas fontaquae]QSF54817.1 TetR family transcriptional regulator C-terminal domain-containing protein [Brevundimonas fontaquae]
MPKIVDHIERRAVIADGLVRVAGCRGLHAVTMRSVAAEAGVSLRLVQYYFETKAQLMHAALQRLEEQSNARWSARLAESKSPQSVRSILDALLTEALPMDERRKTFHLVWTSYAVLAMTEPELAEQPFVEGPNRLELQLANLLKQGQANGELPHELDNAFEAARLLAINHGLGTSVLVGQRTAESALSLMQRHLDQMFG